MVSLGHICIDGTVIKANASNHSAIKKDEFSELKELIQKELEEGIKVDEAEDEIYGDKNIDELPDNITRKTIVERVREKYRSGDKNKKDKIKTKIEKIETEMENTESAISFTDPESRFMPNSDRVKNIRIIHRWLLILHAGSLFPVMLLQKRQIEIIFSPR